MTQPPPSWLDALNPPQREAVIHRDGPLLVLAGAGSGKTRVLTHRIAYLIEVHGVPPSAIAAVTFTNRAAAEMRERVDQLVDDDHAASQIHISTFHSMGARLLRRYARKLGLDWHFSIYDTSDQRRLIKNLLDQQGLDKRRGEVRQRQAFIDRQKNRGHTPRQVLEAAHGPGEEADANFYRDYQKALRRADAADFGDLIVQPLVLFRDHPHIARQLSHQWKYLLVDEFQDTNPAQYELLEHLTSTHNNLCVVGDDDQSIYRWRGADATHILEFDRAFDAVETVKLEQNYRSTSTILDAANDIIAKNEWRHPKELWTERPEGEAITVFTGQDDREEAAFVVEQIFDDLRRGADPQDFAIFYRTNAQSRLFEEQLRQWGVTYRIVGGLSFYDREEIKDLLAYLRAALNPADDIATARIINTPRRGVGNTTVDKLRAAAGLDGVDHLQGALRLRHREEAPQHDLFSAPIASSPEVDEVRSLSGVSRRGLEQFEDILQATRDDLLECDSLMDVLNRLIQRIEYNAHLDKEGPEKARERREHIGELLNALGDFESDIKTEEQLSQLRELLPDDSSDPLLEAEPALLLRAFLDRSALVASPQEEPDLSAVTLMTVHGSKGLEFDTVFAVGLEEGLFPSLRGEGEDPEELAEERRLAYVALTRAKNRLFLTNAQRRRRYGQYKSTRPSRFLLDIDPDRLHISSQSDARRLDYGSSPSRRSSSRGQSSSQDSYQRPSWSYDQSSPADDDQSFNQAPPDDWGLVDPDDGRASADASSPKVAPGTTVSHSRFGIGEVLAVSGDGDKARLTIDFPTVGEKKVIRKFLKILG